MHHRLQSVLFAAIVGVSVSLAASAQTQQRASGGGLAERFKQLDRNGDGKVSREEGGSLSFFDAADKNKDGFLTIEEVQAYFAARAKQPSRGESPPVADTKLHKDLRYRELPGVDANFHTLDVYSPNDAKNAPVLFWIHGGGLTGGSKEPGKKFPGYCARMGMVLVTTNYRLSPAAKHPAHIQDCAAAFQWTYDHIREYGGDPSRIFVAGHSSGAQLANLLCTDPRRLADVGLGLANIKGAIIFDSAAYDMPAGRVTPGSIYEKAFGTDPEVLKDGSPASHIAPGRNIPPHLLVGAKPPQMPMETKVKNLENVAAKYRAAGVRCEVACAFFRQHNTLITEFGPSDEPVTVEVTKFIQSILNNEPVNPPLGGPAKLLQLPGKSQEDVQRENDIKSARTLLKVLDKDGDGKVSRAEAEARGGGHWLRWFPLLDKNKDGFITVEEQTVNTQP